ncbi:MAG: ribonuclease HII, partial [Halanaerobiales bacterium]
MKIGELTIKEIKQELKGTEVNLDLIEKLAADPRRGVKKLAEKYRKKLKQKQLLREKWQQKNTIVEELQQQGFNLIAGLDEAGRGPLAGPVVAAAVILGDKPVLGLDDSKKLTASRREELNTLINKKAIAVGKGIVDNREIDHLNIQNATFL